MWGCGGDSAVQPHSMGGVRGVEEGHTQEHTQERTRECCTCPFKISDLPLKMRPRVGLQKREKKKTEEIQKCRGPKMTNLALFRYSCSYFWGLTRGGG